MNVISARTPGTSNSLVSAFSGPGIISLPRHEPAEWLPVPVRRPRGRPSSLRIYAPARSHSFAEKLLFAVFAVVAIGAIAYGFSCAMDLVQNWALFNSGVERLIQQ